MNASPLPVSFAENAPDEDLKQQACACANADQFARIAAHDLREPLRVIMSLTALLEKEYGHLLDKQGREYMKINRRAAKKMDAIVSDLLEFERLDHPTGPLVPTDCETVLREAIEVLGIEAQSSKAEIIPLGQFPTVNANPVRLLRLFQNLIGNAMKYGKQETAPVVVIHVEEKEGCWLFSVADNGIGIEEAYLEEIFSPFKRLHTKTGHPGTGIGLALCKKIIEEMNGKIWAESTAGKGSTFFFTLPKRER